VVEVSRFSKDEKVGKKQKECLKGAKDAKTAWVREDSGRSVRVERNRESICRTTVQVSRGE